MVALYTCSKMGQRPALRPNTRRTHTNQHLYIAGIRVLSSSGQCSHGIRHRDSHTILHAAKRYSRHRHTLPQPHRSIGLPIGNEPYRPRLSVAPKPTEIRRRPRYLQPRPLVRSKSTDTDSYQISYFDTNVVILLGGKVVLPFVVPTGLRVSPETSLVRYICHWREPSERRRLKSCRFSL